MQAPLMVRGASCLPRYPHATPPWEWFGVCRDYRIGREPAVADVRRQIVAHRSGGAALHILIPEAHSGRCGETAWRPSSQGQTGFASKDCCRTLATVKSL